MAVLAIAPREAAEFPSIASVFHGAEWHERETRDFYGFTYTGNPNFIPLLMPETMPDVHPLAKEESARASLATIFSAPARERKVVRKADGFALLDPPAPAESAPEAPAPEKPAAKAEAVAEKNAAPTTGAEDAPTEEKPAPAKKAVKAASGKKGEENA